MQINPERLAFALKETRNTDGIPFEEFANSFLSDEFPNLQPIGGMHDSGMDGLLYLSNSAPKTIIQSSVTIPDGIATKIKKTVQRLKNAGKSFSELIYCSPHQDVTKKLENTTIELRSQGISLLLRDAAYFTAFCNKGNARIVASESYFNKIGAPILTPAKLTSDQQVQLTTEEEKFLLVFFGATLAKSNSEKSILNICYETVVTYCLRDTTSVNCLTKAEILKTARQISEHDHDDVFNARINGAIKKLISKDTIKHYIKEDKYHLANNERERTTTSLLELHGKMTLALNDMSEFIKEIRTALGLPLAIDENNYSKILLTIINSILSSQSNIATSALSKKQFHSLEHSSLKEIIAEKTSELPLPPQDKEATIQFFTILVETMLQRPPPVIASYLRSVADAYFLFFLLRQPSNIQDALRKIIGHGKIVLDASVIIPALAEYAYNKDMRIRQNLLTATHNAGASLYIADLGIAEIVTHIRKARTIYERIKNGESHYGHSALIDAFFSKQNTEFSSFNEFIEYFTEGDAQQNIEELLRTEFQIKRLTIAPVTTDLVEKLNKLTAVWRALRSKPDSLDDDDFTTLIQNDARTYLHIKSERSKQISSEKSYGESWWWLTEDSTARSIDKSESTNTISICMQPDYLLRYVSIMPRSRATDKENQLAPLPISIEMAGLGLIPDEILAANAKAAEILDDEPLFRRQIKLRNFINSSRAN